MSLKPTSKHKQSNLMYPDLLDQLNPKHPLLLLAGAIPWSELEEHFLPLYSKTGCPAKPVRLMIELLLLKQIENLSDERVVEAWVQNPYYQSFCGMQCFQWKFPCNPSDLQHFRKRIGEKGLEKILNISLRLRGEAALESAYCDRHNSSRKKYYISDRYKASFQSYCKMLEDSQGRRNFVTP